MNVARKEELMKKLFLILIAVTFSFQMFSAAVLAKTTPAQIAARQAARVQINALNHLLHHTKDPTQREQIIAQIKLIKLSAWS
jgi:hypothetical protein